MLMPNTGDSSSRALRRMPAEWEPQEAMWLSLPHRKGLSYPGAHLDRVYPEYLAFLHALAESGAVYLNVSSEAEEERIRRDIAESLQDQVRCFPIPTDEPWCRDHGATFVLEDDTEMLAIDWDYNAWGGKYEPYEKDAAAARRMAESRGIPCERPGIVLEGGALETNGSGHLLTTASCLLDPNRNLGRSREEIEIVLTRCLGGDTISWLEGSIPGDDTEGHIDTLARFVSPEVIVSAVSPQELVGGESVLDGVEILPLPTPAPLSWKGNPLPASYANFVIANRSVIVPAYGGDSDDRARAMLQEHFPDREVRLLSSRELIFGLGSFHCLTQQLPAEQVGKDEGRDDSGV